MGQLFSQGPSQWGAIFALDEPLPDQRTDKSETKPLILKSTGHCTLLWTRIAVCGLLVCNLVLLLDKVVSTHFLLAIIVVSKVACLWAEPFLLLGRYT